MSAGALVLGVWAALAAPPGFSRFEGWSAACPLDVAADPGALPPLAWAPCPGGGACRTLRLDWPHAGPALSPTPRFGRDAAGRPVLMLTRVAVRPGDPDAHKLWLVAPLDGPVRFAMRQSWAHGDPGCTVFEQDVAGDRFVWGVRGDGRGSAHASKVDGALAGRLGAPGKIEVAARDDGPAITSWTLGDGGLVRIEAPSGAASIRRRGAADFTPLHPSAALPAPLRVGGALPRPIGDGGVFEVGADGERHLAAWDAAGHVRRLGDEAPRGNLGTDGHDLVWTEGAGDAAAVYTAPVPAPGAPLAARRLAPDPGTGLGGSPFAVGCGLAAHWVPRASLRVVRLGDGRAADLAPPPGVAFGPALGVTCDEIVALGWRDDGPTVVRVPLPAALKAR